MPARALSERVGISYSALRRKLSGGSTFSLAELLLIAEVLDVRPSVLLPAAEGTSGRSHDSVEAWADGGLAKGARPLWSQLADRLRRGIRDGVFAEGDALPSEAQLVARFGVSRATVRSAVGQLASEGLVERRSGKGTRVLPAPIATPFRLLSSFAEDMAARGMQPGYGDLSVAEDQAPARVALALGIEVGSPVARIERQLLANGSPIAYSTSWFTPRVIGADRSERPRAVREASPGMLDSMIGARATHGSESVEAGIADASIAALLGIRAGDPVLTVARVARGGDGRALEYVERSYRADRYRYRVELVRP